MLRKMIAIVVFLGLAAPVAWAADMPIVTQEQQAPVVQEMTDQQINDAVRLALQNDATLKPALSNVRVMTASGVVHFDGTVNSQRDKEAIERKARSCPGVLQVLSRIQVIG